MKSLAFLLVFICAVASASSTPTWSEGSIVLADHQVVTGRICVQLEFNAVLLKTDSSFSFLRPENVTSVFVYDKKEKINRKYISVQHDIERPSLYEVVVNGDLRVVRRLASRNPSSNRFEYFCLLGESLIPLNKFRQDVYPRLLSAMPTLEKVIRTERWDVKDLTDDISIAQYFNNSRRNQTLLADR